jgi:hypothetical protein
MPEQFKKLEVGGTKQSGRKKCGEVTTPNGPKSRRRENDTPADTTVLSGLHTCKNASTDTVLPCL